MVAVAYSPALPETASDSDCLGALSPHAYGLTANLICSNRWRNDKRPNLGRETSTPPTTSRRAASDPCLVESE